VAWASGAATVCWAIGSLTGSRMVIWRGYRDSGLLGMTIISLGALQLTRLGAASPLALVIVAAALLSLGMGICSTAFLVAVQTATGWEARGAVTGAHQFCRSIGGTIWISVQGAALGAVLAGALATADALGRGEAGGRFGRLTLLLDPGVRAALPPDQAQALADTLASGLHAVFLLYLAIALVGLVAVAFLPTQRLAEEAPQPARPAVSP
jgi:hypothetical protein